MNFELHFVKGVNLSLDEVTGVLNADHIPEERKITNADSEVILDFVKGKNIKFRSTHRLENSMFEMAMDAYQINANERSITLFIPYTFEAFEIPLKKEIQFILDFLFTNGFTGYDSKSNRLLEPYEQLISPKIGKPLDVPIALPQKRKVNKKQLGIIAIAAVILTILVALMFGDAFVIRYRKTIKKIREQQLEERSRKKPLLTKDWPRKAFYLHTTHA